MPCTIENACENPPCLPPNNDDDDGNDDDGDVDDDDGSAVPCVLTPLYSHRGRPLESKSNSGRSRRDSSNLEPSETSTPSSKACECVGLLLQALPSFEKACRPCAPLW